VITNILRQKRQVNSSPLIKISDDRLPWQSLWLIGSSTTMKIIIYRGVIKLAILLLKKILEVIASEIIKEIIQKNYISKIDIFCYDHTK
jgi:hypothetical protein